MGLLDKRGPFICLFSSKITSVPLQHGSIQYHFAHQLGRTIRRAAAHGVQLVCA